MSFNEVFLKDVAPNEIVVIRKAAPQMKVSRENVPDVNTLLRQRFRPGRSESSAENRILASGSNLTGSRANRNLLPVGTDTEILGVRTLEPGKAEGEVLAQNLLFTFRQWQRAKRCSRCRN